MGKDSGILATVGPYSYIAGVVIAILAGIAMAGNSTVTMALGVLGLLVGLLNVTDKEVKLFLIASIAFLASANSLVALGTAIPEVGAWMPNVFGYLIVFTAPAAAIVAVKALYDISKDR